MANKNTLKQILEEKINKETIYKKVIKKQEKKPRRIEKWILIPICMITLCLFIEKKETKYQANENNNGIEKTEKEENYTNSNGKTYSLQEDTIYIPKESNENMILPFKIQLPKNLVEKKNLILYLQEEIYAYQKIYENDSQSQSIVITIFLDKIKKAEGKTEVIQNREYRIHKSSGSANRSIVQWDYKEQTISMEITNFKEEEIIKILKTIGEEK